MTTKATSRKRPRNRNLGKIPDYELIARFLDDYIKIASGKLGKDTLLSVNIPGRVLRAFQLKCESKGRPYQTQIVDLMREWLSKH
jgi:hypothetical protein